MGNKPINQKQENISGSVINVSDACLNRLKAQALRSEEECIEVNPDYINQRHVEMVQKLRYIDDSHSINSGISFETCERLFDSIERHLNIRKAETPCKADALLNCLIDNSGSIIACSSYVEDYKKCIQNFGRGKL